VTARLSAIAAGIKGGIMYSPKIKEKFIPTLYRMARERKMPMTRLLEEIIQEYLNDHLAEKVLENGANEGEED
jgi:predicted DNA-binding ribbon-helix-helix protein